MRLLCCKAEVIRGHTDNSFEWCMRLQWKLLWNKIFNTVECYWQEPQVIYKKYLQGIFNLLKHTFTKEILVFIWTKHQSQLDDETNRLDKYSQCKHVKKKLKIQSWMIFSTESIRFAHCSFEKHVPNKKKRKFTSNTITSNYVIKKFIIWEWKIKVIESHYQWHIFALYKHCSI